MASTSDASRVLDCALAGFSGGAIMGLLDVPVWAQAPIVLVTCFVVYEPRPIHYAIARWRSRHAMREPLFLTDDGIRAACLLPGETLTVEGERRADGTVYIVGRILRRNGTVRQQGEWIR